MRELLINIIFIVHGTLLASNTSENTDMGGSSTIVPSQWHAVPVTYNGSWNRYQLGPSLNYRHPPPLPRKTQEVAPIRLGLPPNTGGPL